MWDGTITIFSCFGTYFSCVRISFSFEESDFVLGHPGIFAPALVPGKRDNETFCSELFWDVPSLGNPNVNQGGGQLCFSQYYLPPSQIFRPSDIPGK